MRYTGLLAIPKWGDLWWDDNRNVLIDREVSMRIKLLRSLGRNCLELAPPRDEDEGGVADAISKGTPWTEGQVREVDAKTAQYFLRTLLGEETTEDVTPLPAKAAAPTTTKAPAKGEK